MSVSKTTQLLKAAQKRREPLENLVALSGLPEGEILYRINRTPRDGHLKTFGRKVNIMLEAETYDLVVRMAYAQGVTAPEVLRTLIEWGLEQAESQPMCPIASLDTTPSFAVLSRPTHGGAS